MFSIQTITLGNFHIHIYKYIVAKITERLYIGIYLIYDTVHDKNQSTKSTVLRKTVLVYFYC